MSTGQHPARRETDEEQRLREFALADRQAKAEKKRKPYPSLFSFRPRIEAARGPLVVDSPERPPRKLSRAERAKRKTRRKAANVARRRNRAAG